MTGLLSKRRCICRIAGWHNNQDGRGRYCHGMILQKISVIISRFVAEVPQQTVVTPALMDCLNLDGGGTRTGFLFVCASFKKCHIYNG